MFGVCKPLKDFKKVQHELRQAVYMVKKQWEATWVGPQFGWSRVSVDHQGMANGIILVRLMETQIQQLPVVAYCVPGAVNRGSVTSVSTYVWENLRLQPLL